MKRALPAKALAHPGVRRLAGRSVPSVPVERVSGFPSFALLARWDRRAGETDTDRWARRNAQFCRHVVRRGFGCADTVYAFNGAALEIFEAARHQGLRTVLDQTAAPWRWNSRLLREERERWPGWEEHPAEIDESGRLSDREEAEWALADLIVCGSDFARSALADQGGPAQRSAVVAYPGIAARESVVRKARAGGQSDELRVLFAGTLQLRKGVPYLLEAVRRLGAVGVRARLVGPTKLSDTAMKELNHWCEVAGAATREGMEEQYAWADILVLPTLSEGAANVCYEAQTAGVPVLTTFAAGSAIADGRDGWLVPVRDVDALVNVLQDTERVRTMGRFLAERANRMPSRSLGSYGHDLISAIELRPESPIAKQDVERR